MTFTLTPLSHYHSITDPHAPFLISLMEDLSIDFPSHLITSIIDVYQDTITRDKLIFPSTIMWILRHFSIPIPPSPLFTIMALGLVPLNPIVRCYVYYYVWHYVWLNVVINKVSLLLSKIMVTWIFGYYHIAHEMHNMWFRWFSHKRYRSQVLCKLRILVRSQWWNWAFHLRRL